MSRWCAFTFWVVAAGCLAACRSTGHAPPQSEPPPKATIAQVTIVPPTALPLRITANRDLAISPDGTHVAYIAGAIGEPTQLMVRAIDQSEAVPLTGTTPASSPFFSPDGRWIGFFAPGELRKVPITGGSPITLCRTRGDPRGASWGSNDTIVFATGAPGTGLFSVAGAGGEPRVLTTPDSVQGEAAHQFPSVLPGGRGVLFTIQAIGSPVLRDIVFAPLAGIGVLDLNTGHRQRLIFRGSQAEYVRSGHLVFAGVGALRAVRFDLAHMEVLGDPELVIDHVMTKLGGAADFSVSEGGTLVYVPGGGGGQEWKPRELVWVNRQGETEEPIRMPTHNYGLPRLSPDGTRLAFNMIDAARGNFDHGIGVWDLARGRLTQISMLDVAAPVWTADGRRIVFATELGRGPPANLFSQSADGTGPVERLTMNPNAQIPVSSSRDGKDLLLIEEHRADMSATDWHLSVLSLNGSQTPIGVIGPASGPQVHSKASLFDAEISPDGRWLTYMSNESGRYEVYVRPFPDLTAGRWQISSGGGSEPTWARSGRDLYYLDARGLLTTVPIQAAPTFHFGAPTTVLHTRYYSTGNFAPLRNYDVSPDGQRFLMIKDPPARMIVERNWFDRLRRLLPTNGSG